MKALFTIYLLFTTLLFSLDSIAQVPAEKELKSTLISMWEAIEKGDVDRYSTFIHSEYTSFGENDPYLNEGKGMEIEGIKGWLKTASNIHTEMHQPKVVINGTVAWIIYYWTDSGDLKDGSQFSSRGKSTRIFVKENGKWLCIHGHFTSVE